MVKQMETYFLFPLLQRLHRKMRTISTHTQAQMAYEPTLWAKIFHSAPHVNITFHHVDPTFNPENELYLESLGILASVPAGNFLFLTASRSRDAKNQSFSDLTEFLGIYSVFVNLLTS